MFSFDFLTNMTKSWSSFIMWGIIIIVVVLVIRHFSKKINSINQEVDEINRKDKLIIYQSLSKESDGSKNYDDSRKTEESKTKRETKGEKKCREVFEKIFNRSFNKVRPDFIKNDCTDKPLEIDGYNDELKLGFEYQGVQHYKYTPYFHKSENDFEKQKYRDEIKMTECKKNGIKIIEVPYTVDVEDIEDFVVQKLKDEGYLLD